MLTFLYATLIVLFVVLVFSLLQCIIIFFFGGGGGGDEEAFRFLLDCGIFHKLANFKLC